MEAHKSPLIFHSRWDTSHYQFYMKLGNSSVVCVRVCALSGPSSLQIAKVMGAPQLSGELKLWVGFVLGSKVVIGLGWESPFGDRNKSLYVCGLVFMKLLNGNVVVSFWDLQPFG